MHARVAGSGRHRIGPLKRQTTGEAMATSAMASSDDALRSLPEVLRRYWGFGSLLPLQAEAMSCVVRGRDSVVVLPTGGGKSLCFQAPPCVCPGWPWWCRR